MSEKINLQEGHVPDIQHPYTNYSLADAVRMAKNHAKWLGYPPLDTFVKVRDLIQSMMDRVGHTWLTGAAALDVLDAYIDDRDLTQDCRLVLGAKKPTSSFRL